MINEIARKVERLANKYDISISRVDEILDMIKNKIGEKDAKAFFVSERKLSYEIKDSETPIQINIMTEEYVFEISFGKENIFYDITKIEQMGIIQVNISLKEVAIKFIMDIQNQTTKIATRNPEEFQKLKDFVSTYEKIIFNKKNGRK